MYFSYGEKETEYLKAKDRWLGEVVDEVGHIDRETDHDLRRKEQEMAASDT